MSATLYLLGLNPPVREPIRKRLALDDIAPLTHVRLKLRSPFSNQGYPEDAEGLLMDFHEIGVIVGVADPAIPRIMVPWSQIVYLGDGTFLKEYLSRPKSS